MNRTFLGLFKSLFPWILYSLMINYLHINAIYSAITSIIVTLLLGLSYLKKCYIISWIVLINLSFVLLLELFLPGTYIQRDPWLLSSLILSMIAWISIAIHKPFTMQYARESLPKEKWIHPSFIRINKMVSLTWAIIFSLSFFLHVMIMENLLNYIVLTKMIFILTAVGIVFSIYYPKHARQKIRQQKNEVA